MVKLLLLIAAIVLAVSCYSQTYLHAGRKTAIKRLNKYSSRNNKHAELLQTDSTVSFLLRDSSVRYMDIILYFGNNGKCNKEETVFDCDSCFRKWLNFRLSEKVYKWRKLSSAPIYPNT